jgi:hypothetical protein
MRKITFNQILQLVENKKGKLFLSENDNVLSDTFFEIQCELGHVWKTCWNYLRRGRWCIHCYNKNFITNDDVNRVIEERAGVLLTPYINSKTPIKIKCKYDHEWNSLAYNVVKGGSWCPYCMNFRSEEICRIAFESIFNEKFPKYRPKQLVGVVGRQLEIDGYCPQLGIGFEHNGDQHYGDVRFFNSKYQKNLVENDKLKIKYCNENNIKLVIIPQLFTHTKYENLISFIVDNLMQQNCQFILPEDKNIQLNLSGIYHNNRQENWLMTAKMIAENHGGKCLSNTFIQILFPMEWQCKKGHIWMAPLSRIKAGSWCEQCYHESKQRDDYYEEIKDDILNLYFNKFETLDSIAKMMHISSPTISKLFKKWNIDPNLVKFKKCNLKLNKEKVLEIRASTLNYQELANKYGVSIQTIRNIIQNKTWKKL